MTLRIRVTPIFEVDPSIYNPNRLRAAIRPSILRPLVAVVESDFDSHVQHYSNSPNVQKRVAALDADIFVSDRIVSMVNLGTRPHVIRARDGGVLAFQTGYSPKTTPGVIPSRPGGATGGETIFAKQVNHPGFEARAVDLAIQRKNQPEAVRLAVAMFRRLYG